LNELSHFLWIEHDGMPAIVGQALRAIAGNLALRSLKDAAHFVMAD